jgi:hypothetical protein
MPERPLQDPRVDLRVRIIAVQFGKGTGGTGRAAIPIPININTDRTVAILSRGFIIAAAEKTAPECHTREKNHSEKKF